MNCPYCNHPETKVIDSRESKDTSSIKRRRECLKCEKRFSTVERILKLDLEVVKSTGEVEVFNLLKIKKGILKACEKRPITLEQIDSLVSGIVEELKKVEETQIPTEIVGTIVLSKLKELDEIAFLRFALVHNKYDSMGDFMKDFKSLDKVKYK